MLNSSRSKRPAKLSHRSPHSSKLAHNRKSSQFRPKLSKLNPVVITKRQNTTTPTHTQPNNSYLSLPITTWPLDTPLSANSKSALVGETSIFYRPLFGDKIPPKVHMLGEISLPFTTSPQSNNHSTKHVSHGGNEVLPLNTLSYVLSQAVLHNTFISQNDFDKFGNDPPPPIIFGELMEANSSNKIKTADNLSDSKSGEQNVIKKSNQIQPNSVISDHILNIYVHHLQYNTENLLAPDPSGEIQDNWIQNPLPLPAYLLQGHYSNIKSLVSSFKNYISKNYTLSPKLLAKIFNVDLETIQENSSLEQFLQERHFSLLTSFVLGRLLVSIDSNYTPIHLSDLPHLNTRNGNQKDESFLSGYEDLRNSKNTPQNISQSNDIQNCSDMIQTVLEKQAPQNIIPLTYLPRQLYGIDQQIDKNTSKPSSKNYSKNCSKNYSKNYSSLRASNLKSIKLHHGFVEPPRPSPTNPQQLRKTLAPLPTTLQTIPLGYLLPLPLLTSIIASQSSNTFLLKSASSIFQETYHTTLTPQYLPRYKKTRTLYGGFNNFVPTRVDYVDLYQKRFTKWAEGWLTSKSRLPQLNVLDMGCGTGVLSVTSHDIFHHLANVDGNMYQDHDEGFDQFGQEHFKKKSSPSFDQFQDNYSEFSKFLAHKRPQPFRLNITAADISPRAVTTSQKNADLLVYYHENEPNGEYVHGDLFESDGFRSGDSKNSYKKPSTPQTLYKSKYGSQYSYSIQTKAVCSNLFESLPHPEPQPSLLLPSPPHSTTPFYDLVVFNPPWLPLPQRSLANSADRAIYDGGFETLTNFLTQCKAHLRSSQPFYQHLYRKVKGNSVVNHKRGGLKGDNDISDGSQLGSLIRQNNRNFNEVFGENFSDLNKFNRDDQSFETSDSASLQKHQHVYERNLSEVWIIISDLFQSLHLDQSLNYYKHSHQLNNPTKSTNILHQRYPAQSKFISFLENTSGLVVVDILDQQSHNFDTNNSKYSSDLDALRSKERVMLYVLRDSAPY